MDVVRQTELDVSGVVLPAKCVAITGASRGIGQATAAAFARAGADVAINGNVGFVAEPGEGRP